MSDSLLADLRALAEKWKHPGLTCEPWDDVTDDLRDLIAKHEDAKHEAKPDVSERDELIRLIWDDDTAYDDAATLADAILARGWRRR